jgi:uncharacterized protein YndB with AHSA1/START domain
MKIDVDLEELLPHPIEAVWRELTGAAAISDWLMVTTDFRATAGFRFHLRSDHLSTTGWIEAEVVEVDPPRRMVWSCSAVDGTPPSHVTFELTPEAAGTRLRLRHVGDLAPEVVELLRNGWPGRITALEHSIRRAEHG